MSYSVDEVRQGIVLLVDYLKSVHGRSVARKIQEETGRNYSSAELAKIDMKDKVVLPLLEFAGIRPGEFYTFIGKDSYGHLPLYLYEIERLSPSQVRSLKIHLRHKERQVEKRPPAIPILELEDKRFHLPPKIVANNCWATLSTSSDDLELHQAWAILSTLSRGQAKYSRSAYCARRALDYLPKVPKWEGKLLQRIAYLVLHLCDYTSAIDVVLRARRAYDKAGDQSGVAKTYIDEAKAYCFIGDYKSASAVSGIGKRLMDSSQLMTKGLLFWIEGMVALDDHDLIKAWDVYGEFVRLITENALLNLPYWHAYTNHLKAQILIGENRFLEASSLLRVLHADPSNSLPTADRVRIALHLILCHVELNQFGSVPALGLQTRAYLDGLTPQTSAIRKYRKILKYLECHSRLNRRVVEDSIRAARMTPPTKRGRGRVPI